MPDTHRFCLERGRRQYELTNHTGDVLATITDRKISVDSDPDSLVDFYRADIITADDYYSFGMQMPSRHWQADSADQYRFGFQGMRKGNQLYGDGNLYETPFRNYDPHLGRWRSPDHIQHPWQGSHTAFNNNPIYFVDPIGLEGDENDGTGGDEDCWDKDCGDTDITLSIVTVTAEGAGKNNTAKMPMTGKSPEEILSEVQPVNPAPKIDDLNHVDIFEPTSEKVSRKQFNRDFNFFIRNASDETVGELISRDSRLPLRLKLRAIRITVRDGQQEFLDHPLGGGLVYFAATGGLGTASVTLKGASSGYRLFNKAC